VVGCEGGGGAGVAESESKVKCFFLCICLGVGGKSTCLSNKDTHNLYHHERSFIHFLRLNASYFIFYTTLMTSSYFPRAQPLLQSSKCYTGPPMYH